MPLVTFSQESNMPTQGKRDAAYHCEIGKILTAAYRREFSMQEMGKCKAKFPTFNEWHATLNADQRQRVDGDACLGIWRVSRNGSCFR